LKYIPIKEGVKGIAPWAASPSGGERGSFSKLPQRINEYRKKRISTESFI